MLNYTIDVCEAKDKTMWIATSTGVAKMNVQANTMRAYQHRENDKRSLSYNIVTSCFEDVMHQIWIATLGRRTESLSSTQ